MGVINQVKKINKGIEVIIRTANIQDSGKMIELIKTIDSENRYMIRKPGEYKKTLSEMELRINNIIISKNSLLAVAEVDGQIVGYVKFDGKNKERLKHKGEFPIGITKNYWGKGIGSFLMEEMLGWCKNAGIVKAELKVAEENNRGIQLYKKYGFKVVGRLEKDVYLENGEYLNFLLMDKIM